MKLIKKDSGEIVESGNLNDLLGQANSGDAIFLYEGNWQYWQPHPQGVIICLKGKPNPFINGDNRRIAFDADESYNSALERSKSPIRLADGNKLLLGNQVLYEGVIDEWCPGIHGPVIRQGNQFILVFFKG